MVAGVLLLALTAVVPAAQAASMGPKWPGRTITYFDATLDKPAVARAVAAWNTSGMNMRFVRSTNRTRAQLLIRNSTNVPRGCGSGLATVGYPGRGRQAMLNILHGPATLQKCAWPGQTLTLAHELGHVLGLTHETRVCSIMNPNSTGGVAMNGCYGANDQRTALTRAGDWRCRILEQVDVTRMVARYGGVAKPVRADPWCMLYTPVAAPAISAAWDAEQGHLVLRITRPVEPPLVPFLQSIAGQGSTYELQRAAGTTCIAAPTDYALDPSSLVFRGWRSDVAPGTEQVVDVEALAPGDYCFSVWARNGLGKPGLTYGSVVATVPVAPVE
ncbi:MAG: hypothetical protein JWM86_2523 [Thermoleophilia bacterium]|nr:hypothetical protein [Thermoleophilia bacterium]